MTVKVMKMSRRINQAGALENLSHQCYQKIDLYMEAQKARSSCRMQLGRLKGGYNGSDRSFREEVLPFWSRFGIKPRKMWYDLYCYSDGKYDPLYIPGDLYWQRVYPALNKVAFRRAYTNKCFYDTLFPYLKKPRTIICNINGMYFDGDRQIISKDEAVRLLDNSGSYVIKPAFYSGGGRDIYFHVRDSGEVTDTAALLSRYKSDYIVQELLEQHDVLAKIHPESVNTIRTISFLFGGEVHISSSVLRMGTSGARMDNIAAGGMACPIGLDGRLGKYAVDREIRWLEVHPSGTVLEKVQVPAYDKILECVKRAHMDVPHFRIIGWDFAVCKLGEPVFIEYNGAPDLNQVSCGPLFGDMTEAVLEHIFLGAPEPVTNPYDVPEFLDAI